LTRIQRSGTGSLPFNGGARREEVAMVAGILLGNAGADGLGALEAARRIKKRALLAAMQLSAAARALGSEINPRRQQGCARGAAHHFALAGQVGRFRAEAFRFLRGWALSALGAFTAAA